MRVTWSLLLMVATLAWTVGCGRQTQPSGGSETSVSVTPETPVAAEVSAVVLEVVLCGKCGQLKGNQSCCLENAAACADCELAKGSPGCCKITKGADVPLCAKCGQIEGSEGCCDPKADVCKKCGLAKGSIACCEIET